jgi:hypothetical protein
LADFLGELSRIADACHAMEQATSKNVLCKDGNRKHSAVLGWRSALKRQSPFDLKPFRGRRPFRMGRKVRYASNDDQIFAAKRMMRCATSGHPLFDTLLVLRLADT